MTLVETLVVRDGEEMLEAHLAFQFAMGVDFVLAAASRRDDRLADVIEPYEREGVLRLLSPDGRRKVGGDVRAQLERLAVSEHGADWVLNAESDELWVPRSDSLPAVLAFIPPRYSVVQALVRVFPPRPPKDNEMFWERMTVRPSLLAPMAVPEPLDRMLRPLIRATLVAQRSRPVPLRAWYPIEVLRFPFRSVAQALQRLEAGMHPPRSALEDAAVALYGDEGVDRTWEEIQVDDLGLARGLADGSLVTDERARYVLEAFHAAHAVPGGPSALEAARSRGIAPTPPGIVADASYAVECAVVGEVDLGVIWSHITSLESHLALFERRFWTRVQRQLERRIRRQPQAG